jgi:hypothetical protein
MAMTSRRLPRPAAGGRPLERFDLVADSCRLAQDLSAASHTDANFIRSLHGRAVTAPPLPATFVTTSEPSSPTSPIGSPSRARSGTSL